MAVMAGRQFQAAARRYGRFSCGQLGRTRTIPMALRVGNLRRRFWPSGAGPSARASCLLAAVLALVGFAASLQSPRRATLVDRVVALHRPVRVPDLPAGPYRGHYPLTHAVDAGCRFMSSSSAASPLPVRQRAVGTAVNVRAARLIDGTDQLQLL